MKEATSIGEAAQRVVAFLGVLFDRILDSADEYADALMKFDPAEPKPSQPDQETGA